MTEAGGAQGDGDDIGERWHWWGPGEDLVELGRGSTAKDLQTVMEGGCEALGIKSTTLNLDEQQKAIRDVAELW
jgi:hypothetical protein